MYIEHKILENGWIKLAEKIDGKLHRSMIAPNKPVEKYNNIIEADEDFATYRTQANIDAYIANSTRPQPSIEQWRESAKLPSRKFWLGVEFYPYNGGFMLGAIETALQGLQGKAKKKVQIELNKTHEFNRNAPSTLMMINAIGMTAEEADAFFIWAENEEWDNL